MKLQNDLCEIRISSEVFTAVTGSAATNCYGVKGMAVRSKTDGLVHLLKRESMAKGVKVYYNEDGTVSIELHIIVENGVNLMAVCRSECTEAAHQRPERIPRSRWRHRHQHGPDHGRRRHRTEEEGMHLRGSGGQRGRLRAAARRSR